VEFETEPEGRSILADTPHDPVSLSDIVSRYRELAGNFGRPVALGSFQFSREETERVFGIFDEDYHISRFFHFSLQPDASRNAALTYRINGFPQSHVLLDAEIESIL
jgi:hypothetical protein